MMSREILATSGCGNCTDTDTGATNVKRMKDRYTVESVSVKTKDELEIVNHHENVQA